MPELIFLPDLAKEIKAAVYQRYKTENNKLLSNRRNITKDLESHLLATYDLVVKIETFQKNVITNKKPAKAELSDATTRNFLVLVSYLLKKESLTEFKGLSSLETLLVELKFNKTTTISTQAINRQLKHWGLPTFNFIHYYAFYYSQGDREPEVALLKIDEDWQQAQLIFYREDSSFFSGTITHEGNAATIFITMSDPNTKYMAFLSMVQQVAGPANEAKRFDGYYCSAMTHAHGNPVAGKMVVIKHSDNQAKMIAEKGVLDAMFITELHNQRLALSLSNHQLQNDKSDQKAKPPIGSYLMYRLDSGKKRINCYRILIAPDGKFSYTMTKGTHVSNYSGQATIINSCLVLAANEKDGATYSATYLFFMADTKAAVTMISGVYATTAFDKAPVCGRAILTADHHNDEPVAPYIIASDRYRKAKPQIASILKFLTGTENNMIKTSHRKNHLERQIRYKDVFYTYACHYATVEPLIYLRHALEHGFNDINQLKLDLQPQGPLFLLKHKITVHNTKKGLTRVELKINEPANSYYLKSQ